MRAVQQMALLVAMVGGLSILLWIGRAGRRNDHTIQCRGHLKAIQVMALSYSHVHGGGYYPFGPGPNPAAHESLQLLVDAQADSSPKLFCCPDADNRPARVKYDGTFWLTAASLGYAWTAVPLEATATGKILAACKYPDGHVDADGEHAGHPGGVNVVYTDGAVRFLSLAELDPTTGLPPGLTR